MGYWWFRVAEGLGILSRLSAYASVYPVCCIYGMPHGTQCECFLASALHCNLWNFVPLNSVRMLRGLCPAHPCLTPCSHQLATHHLSPNPCPICRVVDLVVDPLT